MESRTGTHIRKTMMQLTTSQSPSLNRLGPTPQVRNRHTCKQTGGNHMPRQKRTISDDDFTEEELSIIYGVNRGGPLGNGAYDIPYGKKPKTFQQGCIYPDGCPAQKRFRLCGNPYPKCSYRYNCRFRNVRKNLTRFWLIVTEHVYTAIHG